MGFPDDKDKNINGAECERKQGNEKVVIAIMGQNVNENKAMTKVRHCN